MQFRCWFAGLALSLGLSLALPCAASDALQVLHWWTSQGERKAADTLAARLAQENIQWRDAAIAGGAGVGAGKVLKSRVLAGKSPEVMQLIGVSLSEWADLGLLLQLDGVATQANWKNTLYPSVWQQVQSHGHVMAAPLGIHRINTVFYNRKLFQRLGLSVPNTWTEFEQVAAKLKEAGVPPLAQSSEAWQVATLFETLVLAESGPAYYRALFEKKSAAAYADPRLLHALQRLRALKKWMGPSLRELSWTEVTQQLQDEKAGMLVMGDWVKGELLAQGLRVDEDFGCASVPGTANFHLYSIDTLAMFAADYAHQASQEKMANIITSTPTQLEYNLVKGSIPVKRQLDLNKFDRCAKQSNEVFAKGSSVQAPSLVHRMASDEATKDAIIFEVQRYFLDDKISAAHAQQRLANVVQALAKDKP